VIINTTEEAESWTMIDLPLFVRQKNGDCKELRSGDVFFVAILQKSKRNKQACTVTIRSPIQIRNALPISMNLVVKNHMRNYVQELTINTLETMGLDFCSHNHLVSISLKLPFFV
jgi:hypothetical protein